ncbi:hypothetical protein KJZ63_05130 [Patescibacteria group bacterium]|nr:hypothetical protein [Patescibacteria group bacterium]
MLQATLGFNLTDPALATGVFLMGVKALFMVGVLTYLVFSFIIVRQIVVMKNTLITPVAPVLQLVSWAHLLTVVFFGLVFLLIL